MAIDDDIIQAESMITQKSEMEGMGEQIFDDKEDNGMSNIDMKTNLDHDEVVLCMLNDKIFDAIGLPELSPSRQFKRLASSRKGWKMEKFVSGAQAMNTMRSGGGFFDRIGDAFRRRE